MTVLLHRTLSKPPLGIKQQFFLVLAQKNKQFFFYIHTYITVPHSENVLTLAHRKEYSALTSKHT